MLFARHSRTDVQTNTISLLRSLLASNPSCKPSSPTVTHRRASENHHLSCRHLHGSAPTLSQTGVLGRDCCLFLPVVAKIGRPASRLHSFGLVHGPVQKSLQITVNLLRQQQNDKALPKQQATKVKHLIRFVFWKQARGGDRHRQLRDLDCDTLKFCGLSYTTEDIVKMEDAKFALLQSHSVEYMHSRKLSHLLYRPDVDKAVDAKLEDPDDESSFDKFMQCTNWFLVTN